MAGVIRRLFLALIRLFYTPLRATLAQPLPEQGPGIFVANHPNGLLDPVVVRLAVGRPAHFLAKSTLFRTAIGRVTMEAFGGIPVYRARDGQNTQDNERSFALCRDVLAKGGWIALFPEGTSHSDPSLKPLKTGAARIALSAVEALGLERLPIYPTGLTFEAKETFRTGALATVGEPIDAVAFAQEHGTDFAAATMLTERIHEALSGVLLESDSQELWRGFLAVASWTDPACRDDLALRQARARSLRDAFQRLHAEDPVRAGQVVDATRALARRLEQVGIDDPFAVAEPPPIAPLRFLGPLVLLFPLAALGALLGWVPYRLVRPLSLRLAGRESDLVGTIKLIMGLAVLTGAYLLEALLVGWRFGAPAGLATFAVAPLLGYVALRYGERLDARRAVLRAHWLRATEGQRRAAIVAARDELGAAVQGALSAQRPSDAPDAAPAR